MLLRSNIFDSIDGYSIVLTSISKVKVSLSLNIVKITLSFSLISDDTSSRVSSSVISRSFTFLIISPGFTPAINAGVSSITLTTTILLSFF